MATFHTQHVSIKGIASTVPKKEVFNQDYPHLSDKEKALIVKSIGINSRRIAATSTTASDLCFHAATTLLQRLNWQKEDISILVFVTQTPDFITPCTAAILQNRLGLPKHCLAFDVNLGCSGYPYGLAIVSNFLQNMPGAKGLLLIGDKSSQLVSETDKSTALLFSDAGCATALENDETSQKMWFDLSTDGSGYQSLMVKDGGGRYPTSTASLEKEVVRDGIERNALNLTMNGIDIFNFSIRQVVPSIRSFLNFSAYIPEQIDYFVFHQANKIINESMRKMLKLEPQKILNSLNLYGNSSSASIPLTISTQYIQLLAQKNNTLFLSGFGVGLSWGNAIIHTKDLILLPVLEFSKT